MQLVFCKKKTMWFIGVEVEQETSAPPPKKNPGSAPAYPGFIQQIAIIFKDFPRTSFDFRRIPTRNVHHRFVHVDTFPECPS